MTDIYLTFPIRVEMVVDYKVGSDSLLNAYFRLPDTEYPAWQPSEQLEYALVQYAKAKALK